MGGNYTEIEKPFLENESKTPVALLRRTSACFVWEKLSVHPISGGVTPVPFTDLAIPLISTPESVSKCC